MTNDITILSCPQCGFPRIRDCGNGLYQCDDCGAHFDKDENIVLTEQEWLQTATTEQLADCISDITCNCWGCKRIYVEDCPNYARYKACFCDREDVLDWLKQPHTTIKE